MNNISLSYENNTSALQADSTIPNQNITNEDNNTTTTLKHRSSSILETVYEELIEKSTVSPPNPVSSSSNYTLIYDNFISQYRNNTNTNTTNNSTTENVVKHNNDNNSKVALDDNDGNLIIHIGDILLSTRYPNIQYYIEGIQGNGSFGTVVRARIQTRVNTTLSNSTDKPISNTEPYPPYLTPGNTVAIKIVRNHPVYRSQASVEIHLLTLLAKTLHNTSITTSSSSNTIPKTDTSNIVRLYDHFTAAGGHLCIVLEYLPTTVLELLQKSGFLGLNLLFIKIILIQLLLIIHQLHIQGLIHCDIKPENIMLNGNNIQTLLNIPETTDTKNTIDKNNDTTSTESPSLSQRYHQYLTTLPIDTFTTPSSILVKLIDFGSAGYEHSNCYHYVQSRFYRAPEVMFGCTYDGSADIWSIGCVAAELFFGLPLFPGCDELDCVRRIFTLLGWAPEYMIIGGNQAHRFFRTDNNTTNSVTTPTDTQANGKESIIDPALQEVVQVVSATLESSTTTLPKVDSKGSKVDLTNEEIIQEEEHGRPRHGAFAEPALDDEDLDLLPTEENTTSNNTKPISSSSTSSTIPSTILPSSLIPLTISYRSKLSVPSKLIHFRSSHQFSKLSGKPAGIPKYYYASNCLEQLVMEFDARQGFIPNLYTQQQTTIVKQIQQYHKELESTNSSYTLYPYNIHNNINQEIYHNKEINLPYNLDTNEISERKLFADLLRSLLTIDPRYRPTAASILSHPFFHTNNEITKLWLSKDILNKLSYEDNEYVKPRRQKTIDINIEAYNHITIRNGIGIHHNYKNIHSNNNIGVPSPMSSPVIHPLDISSSNIMDNNGGLWWLSTDQQQHIYQSMPWLLNSFTVNNNDSLNNLQLPPNYYENNMYSSQQSYYSTNTMDNPNTTGNRGYSYSMSAVNNQPHTPLVRSRNNQIIASNRYLDFSPPFNHNPPMNNTNATNNNEYRSRTLSNMSDNYLPLSPPLNGNNIPEATGGYYNGEGLRMSSVIKEGYMSIGRSISGEIIMPPSNAYTNTNNNNNGSIYPSSSCTTTNIKF